MDRRQRPRGSNPLPHSPLPGHPPSPLFRDISNYTTPRRPATGPNPNPNPNPNPSRSPIFFTASNLTPCSSSASFSTTSSAHIRPSPSPAARSKAARRLTALQLDQSRSARKIQLHRQQELKSFTRSITGWLNLLLKDPQSCGCTHPWRENGSSTTTGIPGSKRESFDRCGVNGIESGWRCPKRRCKEEKKHGVGHKLAPKALATLRESLRDVCSLEDMVERLGSYTSSAGCNEVLCMMSQVCKNIDEGRLKMKAHCPIVTDLGHKKKATEIILCYSSIWLQIGLHIVFGGDFSWTERSNSAQDLFLKTFIDKQFFSHASLAKSYACNKSVDGLYRPGYYEALGNIILKRFLLLVISLDMAKCESALPLMYGIDGKDGGSFLLFHPETKIKSSRQVIHEFLYEAMHGEGDLLAHLLVVGCKVNHKQLSLAEYDFSVSNLFDDIKDGVLLCRVIQLLHSDASILLKVLVPSDNRKKNMHNCSIALQYLNRLKVPLCDSDGIEIMAEDIANGDRELCLSILWNVFVYLQVPLLIKRSLLAEEITKIKGHCPDFSSFDDKTDLSLILEWIEVTCESYDLRAESITSLRNGRALCCLIDYYLRTEFRCTSEETQVFYETGFLELFDNNKCDAFLLLRRVAAAFGCFPENLEVNDLADPNKYYDEHDIVILAVFLASYLTDKKKMDQLKTYRITTSFYQSLEAMKLSSPRPLLSRCNFQNTDELLQDNALTFESPLKGLNKCNIEGGAATKIQCHFRGLIQRRRYVKVKLTITFLQTVIRAWLCMNLRNLSKGINIDFCTDSSSGINNRYFSFFVERHKFVRTKRSVLLIQRAFRAWNSRRQKEECVSHFHDVKISGDVKVAAVVLSFQNIVYIHQERQTHDHESRAATVIQVAWRAHNSSHKVMLAAVKIQRRWRSYCMRKEFCQQTRAILTIQSAIRRVICQRSIDHLRYSSLEIQRFIRGRIVRNRLLGASSLRSINSCRQCSEISRNNTLGDRELRIFVNIVIKLQKWWRQVLLRNSRFSSAVLIQSVIRGFCARIFTDKKKLCLYFLQQRWKYILYVKKRKQSAIIIEAHVRGWIARRAVFSNIRRITTIQSYWRGYLVRKCLSQKLLELSCKMKHSVANVEDNLRLINRIVAALAQLHGCDRISDILHVCATINIATAHADKCCEVLVASGAIGTLLELVHSLNRGIPEREVLKHVLSTLRNIVDNPKYIKAFLETPMSIKTVFHEVFRNKNEGFFIACEILRKLCSTSEGLEAVYELKGHVRRLDILAKDLERKANLPKRHSCQGSNKSDVRLQRSAAMGLLQLIRNPNRR